MCGRLWDCKQLFETQWNDGKCLNSGARMGSRRRWQKSGINCIIMNRKSMVKTKSVHSPMERADGLRVLAARGRGRGLPADRFDVWMANLGPSEELRDAILGGEISWSEYSRRYLKELREPSGVDLRNKRIKNHGQKFTLRLLQHLAKRQTVTLLCHCAEEEKHCHRHLLKALLEKKI
jgi:uncharacterized protein YeaO (DUF488 family)